MNAEITGRADTWPEVITQVRGPTYTGQTYCRKCGKTHWMHGPCVLEPAIVSDLQFIRPDKVSKPDTLSEECRMQRADNMTPIEDVQKKDYYPYQT